MKSISTPLKVIFIFLIVIPPALGCACVPVLPAEETVPQPDSPPVTVPENTPPVIYGITADDKVMIHSTSEVICQAEDPDGDMLSFNWSAGNGIIHGAGNTVTWTAPGTPGVYSITATVKDGKGGKSVASVSIMVTDTPNRPPVIQRFMIHVQYPHTELIVYPDIPIIERVNPQVRTSRNVDIECIVTDPDGDDLTYTWDIPAGKLTGQGESVRWLAPTEPQRYIIIVTVTDTEGNTDTAKLAIDVECCI